MFSQNWRWSEFSYYLYFQSKAPVLCCIFKFSGLTQNGSNVPWKWTQHMLSIAQWRGVVLLRNFWDAPWRMREWKPCTTWHFFTSADSCCENWGGSCFFPRAVISLAPNPPTTTTCLIEETSCRIAHMHWPHFTLCTLNVHAYKASGHYVFLLYYTVS